MKAERNFEGDAVSPVVMRLMEGKDCIDRCWVNRMPKGSHEHCAWTAVSYCAKSINYLATVLDARIPSLSIPMWNDAPGRTKEEVLDLYDRAIALALNDHA